MKYLYLLWYALLDKQIKWKEIPVNYNFNSGRIKEKDTYRANYSYPFPEKGWSFTLTKIDNATMYDTVLSFHSETIWKTRLESYRDLYKVYHLKGALITNQGIIINKRMVKRFLLKFFLETK